MRTGRVKSQSVTEEHFLRAEKDPGLKNENVAHSMAKISEILGHQSQNPECFRREENCLPSDFEFVTSCAGNSRAVSSKWKWFQSYNFISSRIWSNGRAK